MKEGLLIQFILLFGERPNIAVSFIAFFALSLLLCILLAKKNNLFFLQEKNNDKLQRIAK